MTSAAANPPATPGTGLVRGRLALTVDGVSLGLAVAPAPGTGLRSCSCTGSAA